MNHYLQCLGFVTDWKASSSYDVIMQSFLDVADLEIKKHGKLVSGCEFIPIQKITVYQKILNWLYYPIQEKLLRK